MRMPNPRSVISLAAALLVLVLAVTIWPGWGSTALGAPGDTAPDAATVAAFTKAGCGGCHSIPGVPGALGQVGPDLSTIGSEAGRRVDGQDAATYLRTSILDPNAFLAPRCPLGPCPASVMPPNMADRLAAAELDRIIAYLLTLEGAGVAPALYVLTPIVIERPPEAAAVPFAEPPRSHEDGPVLLGKYLFFDTRLSADATVSCASCHQPDLAWTDGQSLSRGYTGAGYFRNTPTLLNTVHQEWLYWDGRMDGADMPTLVRDHLTEAHFMNTDGRLMVERVKQVPEYVQLFQDATGRGPSFGGILNAITAYVQSLNSPATAYDRYQAGETDALSDEAVAGLALFEANCVACHSGPTFSDGAFYSLGLPENGAIWSEPLNHITFRRFFRQLGVPNYRALRADPGLFALTKAADDFGAFRTAPLREVARTGPYMHNGVFASLEEVVAFYNESRDLGLSDAEITQILRFLENLSSEPVGVTPTEQPAYQLRTLGENR